MSKLQEVKVHVLQVGGDRTYKAGIVTHGEPSHAFMTVQMHNVTITQSWWVYFWLEEYMIVLWLCLPALPNYRNITAVIVTGLNCYDTVSTASADDTHCCKIVASAFAAAQEVGGSIHNFVGQVGLF